MVKRKENCSGRWQWEDGWHLGRGARWGGILKSVLKAQLGQPAGEERGGAIYVGTAPAGRAEVQLEEGGEENWRGNWGGLGVSEGPLCQPGETSAQWLAGIQDCLLQ